MTKSAHIIPIKVSFSTEYYAKFSIWEMKGLGTRVKLSTTFHPQIEGQVEHTIQTFEDVLRSCMMDFKGNWDDHLPLIEFTYNNSYHSSICMAPFEAFFFFYSRRCIYPSGWFEVGKTALIGPELMHEDMKKG
ncbi:hypothetical protein MTR67_012975 [Solanum verrucosum]|uniref:Integrase catalytic domain-containing protein n=1 Tax=Solanum verrucosum TaxID=315347 RepID=A0AAF0QE44_SOLVR|nr:hypothetical protein MTR67_012975 [Solanum verrucosum]